MIELPCSDFRMITPNFLGVRNLRNFMVILHFWTEGLSKQCSAPKELSDQGRSSLIG